MSKTMLTNNNALSLSSKELVLYSKYSENWEKFNSTYNMFLLNNCKYSQDAWVIAIFQGLGQWPVVDENECSKFY